MGAMLDVQAVHALSIAIADAELRGDMLAVRRLLRR